MLRRFTWDIVYHESIHSTNSLMYDEVSNNPDLNEGYVIRTDYQTSGRGQIGNTWESKWGKNLLTSILLKPNLLAEDQFLISKIICLSLVELLNEYDLEKVRIKWPNDIYVGDKKIAGILIQNMLLGKQIKASIIGIGLNVNQVLFESEAPNPTSLKIQLKRELSVSNILIRFLDILNQYYDKLKDGKKIEVNNLYKFLLYRRNETASFKDMKGSIIKGRIIDVSKSGLLVMETADEVRQFAFREIKYVL